MKKNKMWKLVILFSLVALMPKDGFCFEVSYKQVSDVSIVNGKAQNSKPHAYVTLDFQSDDLVIYKQHDDWNKPEFTGETYRPFKLEKNQGGIRLFTQADESALLFHHLIIDDNSFTEIRNSIFIPGSIVYMRYEKVS